MIINPYIFANNLLLDLYPNAAYAHALFKLRTPYSGNCIKVRRSSDNTTQNIGFTGNDLDTTSLLSFCGAGNGFIDTFYDQSGNGRDITQATTTAQPQIVSSGSVLLENGKPCCTLNGTSQFYSIPSSTALFNFLHNGTTSYVLNVCRVGSGSNPNTFYMLMDNCNAASASTGYSCLFDDRSSLSRNNGFLSLAVKSASGVTVFNNVANDVWTPNIQVLVSDLIDADNGTAANRSIGKVNSNTIQANTQTAAPSSGNASFNLTFGKQANAAVFTPGSFQMHLAWGSDQSANRTAIETYVKNYFGIV